MLSLQLRSGEYLTIGDDVAVQVFRQHGSTFRVEVKAPREVPILRGTVRERQGAPRPGELLDHRPTTPSRRACNTKKAEEQALRRKTRAALREDREHALEEMGRVLDRMEALSGGFALQEELTALRTQLDRAAELNAAEAVL